MNLYQPGILAAPPAAGRHLLFDIAPGSTTDDLKQALTRLAAAADGEGLVIGIGQPLAQALGVTLPGLHAFPAYEADRVTIPDTPHALWCWLRGSDRGTLLHQARQLAHNLAPGFAPALDLEVFRYEDSRDLTGYVDGTENPKDEEAIAVAFAAGQGNGLDGSSIAALQQWVHDLDRFEAMPGEEQDNTFGRRRSDNEEIDDAPENAHVKRTAQESFEPEAFVLRRSMPWSDCGKAGLAFLAFGRDADAFEAQLKRMRGQEDGIVDALFRFTRPITGNYFWCPPMTGGHPNLLALGV